MYVAGEEAPRLLSGADVGVLPFNEDVTLESGFLLALFAHGLSVLATRPDPPEPELVDGQLLRLVKPSRHQFRKVGRCSSCRLLTR